tara:strand:+ start:623 stop:883 length:261 start_codon:yes stop_codon:yes gene_type:complete
LRVYQEKGLGCAVVHELFSNIGPIPGRLARAINYLAVVLDIGGDPMSFKDLWKYNREIRKGRIENILNPNLITDSWAPANWTEECT